MSAHSVLSPSSAHRRLRCVGSLAATKHIESPPNEYSAEGTLYHAISADALLTGKDCNQVATVGEKRIVDGFTFTVTEDNLAHAQTYVDAIRRRPGEREIEVQVRTSLWHGIPDQSGTADAIVLNYEERRLEVHDLKFGFGVVDAKDNEQLLSYAAAALAQYDMLCDWETVLVAIHQPRVREAPDEHTYAVGEVIGWAMDAMKLESAAYALWKDTPADLTPYLTPSDKGCQWCPICGSCSVRNNAMLSMFPVYQVGVEMSSERLAETLARLDSIEAWCRDIRGEALARAMQGVAIPGWKLVQGRKGPRKWSDEENAAATLEIGLGEKAFKPREIITPAVAEKALKKHSALWDILQQWITQSDGAPSLAREDDGRPTIAPNNVEFPVEGNT